MYAQWSQQQQQRHSIDCEGAGLRGNAGEIQLSDMEAVGAKSECLSHMPPRFAVGISPNEQARRAGLALAKKVFE
jgi:hypothetical protein